MNFKEFQKELGLVPADKIAFVALGNDMRGDDGAGLIFARRLKKTDRHRESHFIFAGTTPENYMQILLNLNADIIIFIDAARWGGTPGELCWLDNKQIDKAGMSTHSYSIRMIEEYLQAQQAITIKYLAIEPQTMKMGSGLSAVVNSSIENFFDKMKSGDQKKGIIPSAHISN